MVQQYNYKNMKFNLPATNDNTLQGLGKLMQK